MDRSAISRIAHGELEILNPLAPATVDEVVAQLRLPAGGRAVDIGCGRGDLLRRVAAAYAVTGLGVELDPLQVAAAEAAAAAAGVADRLRFVAADARALELDRAAFDLAACVGSTHALGGGQREAIDALARLARPGGLVLLGDGYWQRPPSAAYLEALGASADELGTYGDVVRAGLQAGLEPLHVAVATEADRDRYEWTLIGNAERYAAAHPGEPGVADLLAHQRRHRDRVLLDDGRGTLGFGLFLFRR